MDLAEDRDRFNRLMDDLGILQPEGGSATSEAEALDLANDLGYPVLVRPSTSSAAARWTWCTPTRTSKRTSRKPSV